MLFQISDIWGQWWKEGKKKKSYFILALQSKFYLSLLHLWIVYILCGKTNRFVWPRRPRLPGNSLNGSRASPPPPGGAVLKCDIQQGQQVLATGTPDNQLLNSCHLTSDCRIPKQTLCPSWQGHSHACSIKRENNCVGVGDSNASPRVQIHISATCPDPSVPPQSAETRDCVCSTSAHRFQVVPKTSH